MSSSPISSPLLLKRSSVPGRLPSLEQLEYGELAINYADGIISFRTATDTIASFPQAPAEIDVTAGATLTIDLMNGRTNLVRVLLEQVTTTISFINPKDAQRFVIELTQGTGNNAVVWPSNWRLSTDSQADFVLSTAQNYLDRIGVVYDAALSTFDVLAFSLGYHP